MQGTNSFIIGGCMTFGRPRRGKPSGFWVLQLGEIRVCVPHVYM